MYNKDTKIKYLESIIDNDDFYFNKVSLLFKKTESWETKFNKDIIYFTKDELMEFYIMLCYNNGRSIDMINRQLKNYCEWMIKNKLFDGQSVFNTLHREDFNNCVPKINYQKQLISKEILNDLISKQNNYYNKFILLGMFSGLKGSNFCELTLAEPQHLHLENLTMDVYRYDKDLKPYLHRNIKVPKELIEYGMKSANTYERYDENGRMNGLLIGKEIIKQVKDSKSLIDFHDVDEQSKNIIKKYNDISRRFTNINKKYNISVNGQNIFNSGFYHRLKQKANELNLTIINVFNSEHLNIIMKDFGYELTKTAKDNFKMNFKKYLE